MYESLHNHTTASDGTQTYMEVLRTAESNNYGVIAFTDHDMLPSEPDIDKLKEYKGPVKWLVGCEISSGLPRELGGGVASTLHILGLFTDPTNKPLRSHCEKALKARSERMKRIVANLVGLGFTITEEDCMKASGGESVGRPHIVRALNMHPENAAVTESIRVEMEKASVNSPAIAMDYMRMLERSTTDYPYRLFLSDDAFKPAVYVDYLYSIDLDTAVELIRGAGGIAVLAHWYTAERKIKAELLEVLITSGRLDGIELMGNPKNPAAKRAMPTLEAVAGRTGTTATYGVDGHYWQDLESFAGDATLASRSVGQTQAIINKFVPDLGFSNLA